jgi:flagellar L-ring protein FlgH
MKAFITSLIATVGFISPLVFAQLGASPGSVFTPSGRLADSTRDLRASSVGDIVTIVVSDSANAIAKGVTNTARKSSAKKTIAALAGPLSAGNPLASLASLQNDQQLQSQGQTSRGMTLTTTISVVVTEVMPNGNLVVQGTKNIAVNSEKQAITLMGMVRPNDLTTANTIRSDQVAGLTVQVNGKGVVGDSIKRPFVLYRILLGLLPF